jgi:hypothetical protein
MQTPPRTFRRLSAIAAAILTFVSSAVLFGQFGRQSNSAMTFASADSFDGAFQFCRIFFRQAMNGDGGDWRVDFPRADQNLSIRLAELTRAPVSFDHLNEPNHLVIRLTQPELFHCPFVMMTEVGSMYIDEAEVGALREYLLKGGFLWADDFWGEYAWAIWESQIRKVFPSSTHPIVDLPFDHPVFNQFLAMKRFPQIPSIGWARSSTTSERFDSQTPHARAILDEGGRVMVLITHNTDFGDSWEREGDDPAYFQRFSVEGYAFGMNVLIYAMTH